LCGGGSLTRLQASKTRAQKKKTMLTASNTRIQPGRLLIDGQWVDGSRKFDTINPATGEVLTQVVEASAHDVERAVQAAHKAFEDRSGTWRKMSASERGRLIWRLADLIEKNIDELAELETLDNGKPIFESRYVDMPMVIDGRRRSTARPSIHSRRRSLTRCASRSV